MKIDNSGISQAERIRHIQLFLLCCFSLFLPGIVLGDEPVEIQEVKVGIGGYFQVGTQAPLEFKILSKDGRNRVITPQVLTVDPDGHGVLSELPEVEVGERPKSIRTSFRSGKIEAPVQIELLENGRVVSREIIRFDEGYGEGTGGNECLKQDAQLWMIAGDQPAYSAALAKFSEPKANVIRIVEFETGIAGISEGALLESVSLIVLNADTKVSEKASAAIQDWVQQGGRLVVSVGGMYKKLQESPMRRWLPDLPIGQVKIQNLSALNQLIPGSEPLRFLRAIEGAKFDPQSGKVIVTGLETPLVTRSAYGVGMVTYVSVRLDQKPVSTWESRAEFAMILAGQDASAKVGQRVTSVDSELNPTGITDLQTQLIHSLDDYENVQRPTYWIVIGWGALLLVLIGPIDYLLVHQILRKPQLTWITLLLWLIGMTFWTYSSSNSVNAVARQSQQIELIDVDVTTQKATGRAWFNFYSPKTRRYQVHASVDHDQLFNSLQENPKQKNSGKAVSFSQTSWVDRPESSYRGMYRSGGLESRKPTYHLSEDQQGIEDLPVRIYSTGVIGTEWTADLNGLPLVEGALKDPGNGRLTGVITYNGPQELTEWFLAYGQFAYFPRVPRGGEQQPLKKGDEFQIKGARSNLLRGILIGLTQTSIFKDGDLDGPVNIDREVYDPLSRQPFPILRTLSFHELTGGASYTQLNNQSLKNSDLSALLNLQRAVLFGRIKAPITNFSLGDQIEESEHHESVIRFILPVDVGQVDVDAPPDPTLLQRK